jgi:hypothetical protein
MIALFRPPSQTSLRIKMKLARKIASIATIVPSREQGGGSKCDALPRLTAAILRPDCDDPGALLIRNRYGFDAKVCLRCRATPPRVIHHIWGRDNPATIGLTLPPVQRSGAGVVEPPKWFTGMCSNGSGKKGFDG